MMRYSLKQQLVLCFQVIELGQHMHEGTSEQHVYALVGPGEEPAVHLLPDSPQTEALLNASTSPLHFWRCNATTGVLRVCASVRSPTPS